MDNTARALEHLYNALRAMAFAMDNEDFYARQYHLDKKSENYLALYCGTILGEMQGNVAAAIRELEGET